MKFKDIDKIKVAISETLMVSVFLATYFEANSHFDSNVKLFPVIYANYRPMTNIYIFLLNKNSRWMSADGFQ
jgi:hypothetical protein